MIPAYLKALAAMSPVVPGMVSAYQTLLENGLVFPKVDRGNYRLMRIKECFRNSAMTAMENGLIYCEGYAVPDTVQIPIHHAWNVTPEGLIIDRTWRTPGVEYFGIPFDTEYVLDAMLSSGTYGVMFNHCYRDFHQHQADQFIYKGTINHASSFEESQPYQASATNFTGGGFAL